MTRETFRPLAAALLLLAGPGPAAADSGKRDVLGVGLGMSVDKIVAHARVPCRVNKAGNVSCLDPSDGSEIRAMTSGGKPSVAFSIKHSFCSPSAPAAVLAGLLKSYGLSKGDTHANPNGTTLDIAGPVEGILVVGGNPCPQGRRSYQFTLVDGSLIGMQPVESVGRTESAASAAKP